MIAQLLHCYNPDMGYRAANYRIGVWTHPEICFQEAKNGPNGFADSHQWLVQWEWDNIKKIYLQAIDSVGVAGEGVKALLPFWVPDLS